MSRHLDPAMPRWHREAWLKAIWDTDTLKPNERLAAHVFAHYAYEKKTSWCTWDELRRRTGIKSRDAINRAIRGLLDSGWLKETEKARQHFSARYELTVPTGQGSGKQTSQQSGKRTPGAPDDPSSSPSNGHPSSPSPETRSPSNGPDKEPTTHTQQETLGGHAAPPDPPSDETPRKRDVSTTQPDSPPEVVNDQPSSTTQPTTRAPAENNVIDFATSALRIRKECPQCQTWLDPDGSCFICRIPAAPRQHAAGAGP